MATAVRVVGVHVGYRYNWSILVLMHAIRCWWKLEHGGGVLLVSGSMTKNYPGFWRSMGSETVITKGLFPMYPYECRTYLGNYSKIWQFAILPSELIVSAGLPADNMCNSLSESSLTYRVSQGHIVINRRFIPPPPFQNLISNTRSDNVQQTSAFCCWQTCSKAHRTVDNLREPLHMQSNVDKS
jgi:hypothetical protein